MTYRVLADVVVLVHGVFVLFVVLGGLLVIARPRLAWIHIPCAVWGALIEFAGWICPLTPLENALRQRAGEAGYSGGFVEHYVLRALYPAGLTREVQWVLGTLVAIVNIAAYAYILTRRRRRGSLRTSPRNQVSH
jgi:hypothetical protein